MKQFVGKNALKAVLTIFKKDLSKKQDLMSEFTDAEIQAMYSGNTGTNETEPSTP